LATNWRRLESAAKEEIMNALALSALICFQGTSFGTVLCSIDGIERNAVIDTGLAQTIVPEAGVHSSKRSVLIRSGGRAKTLEAIHLDPQYSPHKEAILLGVDFLEHFVLRNFRGRLSLEEGSCSVDLPDHQDCRSFPMRKGSDGLYRILVRWDGWASWSVIDTAAEMSCVSSAWPYLPDSWHRMGEVSIETLFGIKSVPTRSVPRVMVGDFKARDRISVAVWDFEPGIRLRRSLFILGADFLEGHNWHMDFRNLEFIFCQAETQGGPFPAKPVKDRVTPPEQPEGQDPDRPIRAPKDGLIVRFLGFDPMVIGEGEMILWPIGTTPPLLFLGSDVLVRPIEEGSVPDGLTGLVVNSRSFMCET
jgi:hypothetical protein